MDDYGITCPQGKLFLPNPCQLVVGLCPAVWRLISHILYREVHTVLHFSWLQILFVTDFQLGNIIIPYCSALRQNQSRGHHSNRKLWPIALKINDTCTDTREKKDSLKLTLENSHHPFFHCIWHCLRDCYILCLFLETIVLFKPALQLEESNNAFKQNLNLQKQDIASFCYNKGLCHEKSFKN